jgi:membrane fusion protein, multidrug efflux system
VIPQRAVQELQDKNFVWVIDDAGHAQTRDVTMGQRVGADWVVEKGLAAGDTVIVDGVQKLRPGSPVDPKAPETGAKRPS